MMSYQEVKGKTFPLCCVKKFLQLSVQGTGPGCPGDLSFNTYMLRPAQHSVYFSSCAV